MGKDRIFTAQDENHEQEKLPGSEPIRAILAELRELYDRAREMAPAAVFGMLLEQFELFRTAGAEHMEYVYFALELLRQAESTGEIASLEDGAKYLENLLVNDSAAERCVQLNRNGDCVHIANLQLSSE